jgi:hypothetical protein
MMSSWLATAYSMKMSFFYGVKEPAIGNSSVIRPAELPWRFFLTVTPFSLSMRENALDLTTHIFVDAMPLGGASLVRIAQFRRIMTGTAGLN